MNWNPLIASPSPRDIDVVKSALMDCPYDIMYAKYFPMPQASKLLYNYFIEHKQYTHFIWCPDDTVIRPSHIEALRKTLEKHDYPVLSGVCNVDLDEMPDYLSITRNLPHPRKNTKSQVGWRWYHWYHKDEAHGIIRVWHSGNACGIIRRDVLEQIKLTTDETHNPTEPIQEAGSVDVMFSNSCAVAKIQILVDADVRMLHMRKHGPIDITLGDGFMEFHDKAKRHLVKMENTVATY